MLTSGGIQVGWGSQWEALANAINDYYGGGIGSTQYQEVVNMLNSGNYTMEEMESILGSIPEFNRTYNANGQLTSVTYNAASAGNTATGSIANEINSNVANATNTQFSTVQNVTKNAETGKVTISDSVTKYNGGVASQAKAVLGSTVQGVLAASAGISAGKAWSQLCYDHGFNWLSWAGVSMESLNPQSWANITAGDDSTGAKLFNMVFHIDPDSANPQPYMDQETFAYMISYMMAVGVFDGVEHVVPYEGEVGSFISANNDLWIISAADFVNKYILPTARSDFSPDQLAINFFDGTYQNYINRSDVGIVVAAQNGGLGWYKLHPEDTSQSKQIDSITDGVMYILQYQQDMLFSGGYIYAYNTNGSTLSTLFSYNNQAQSLARFLNVTQFPNINNNHFGGYVGSITYENIEGITDQPGATIFDDTGLDPTDTAAVLAALMAQYPELWDNRIEFSPDGDTTKVYIPVGFPTGGVGQNPTTEGASQSDTMPDITGDGDNSTDALIKTLIEILQNPQGQGGMDNTTDTPTDPIDPNGDGTGSGNTPIPILPIGSAEALYSVYNPSQAQLNSFGSWLWSSNFVDQLLKLFNDPMQAIIGLHKVFATPSIGGTSTIKVGYLDSGVSSKTVSNQYTEVDCGTVSLPEYFKNCLDYTDTDVYIYLPFIGIEPLNVEDVTRAKINVKYKVDVLTGACLAMVNVTRDSNAGGQLYVYPGNCAVQYPLSSGSYMGIVTAGLSAAATIAGIIGTGGAAAPALTAANVAKSVGHGLGIASGFMSSARNNVSRSGNLSGNSGAMGIKKPYLIIRRPQTKIADNFSMDGISENKYGVLSSFTGMTKVKYIHLENIPCTGEELTMIEDILKEDVLI